MKKYTLQKLMICSLEIQKERDEENHTKSTDHSDTGRLCSRRHTDIGWGQCMFHHFHTRACTQSSFLKSEESNGDSDENSDDD